MMRSTRADLHARLNDVERRVAHHRTEPCKTAERARDQLRNGRRVAQVVFLSKKQKKRKHSETYQNKLARKGCQQCSPVVRLARFHDVKSDHLIGTLLHDGGCQPLVHATEP